MCMGVLMNLWNSFLVSGRPNQTGLSFWETWLANDRTRPKWYGIFLKTGMKRFKGIMNTAIVSILRLASTIYRFAQDSHRKNMSGLSDCQLISKRQILLQSMADWFRENQWMRYMPNSSRKYEHGMEPERICKILTTLLGIPFTMEIDRFSTAIGQRIGSTFRIIPSDWMTDVCMEEVSAHMYLKVPSSSALPQSKHTLLSNKVTKISYPK